MDREVFFAGLRTPALFSRLSQEQVDGINAILDACQKFGVTDQHHVADILAQVFHETGGYMLPIKETVMPSHKDKNPSDSTVISRLDAAFARGQLTWVKTPYWRDGWFGRGPIQTTHKRNYEKIGKAIGVDLVKNRNSILDPAIGAASAVVGMRDGIYTGKKLSDFDFPLELAKVATSKRFGPRRIVNGVDGTDVKIAAYHRAFYAALQAAGFGKAPVREVPAPTPMSPPAREAPKPAVAAAGGGIIATMVVGAVAASSYIQDGWVWLLSVIGLG